MRISLHGLVGLLVAIIAAAGITEVSAQIVTTEATNGGSTGMSTIEFHNVDNDQRFPIHSKSIVLCNVTGEGLNISWIFKGRVLVRGRRYEPLPDGLKIKNIRLVDHGVYRCHGSDMHGYNDYREINVTTYSTAGDIAVPNVDIFAEESRRIEILCRHKGKQDKLDDFKPVPTEIDSLNEGRVGDVKYRCQEEQKLGQQWFAAFPGFTGGDDPCQFLIFTARFDLMGQYCVVHDEHQCNNHSLWVKVESSSSFQTFLTWKIADFLLDYLCEEGGPFLDAQGFNLQFHVIIEDKEGFTSPVFDDSNNDTHTAFMDGGFEHMVTVFMVDYNAFFPSSIQSQLYYFLVYNESGYIEHQEGEVIGGNFTCDITLIVEAIDECYSNPCQNGGVCEDLYDAFLCNCTAGYEGEFCEVDIDECLSSPCVYGLCDDYVNNYICSCNPGYTGTNCENELDECGSSPCGHGNCTDLVNAYTCEPCQPGFAGTQCETDIDDCSPHPCGNGSCVDGVEDYTCNCDPGYAGDNCETEINECDSSPCINGDCDDLIDGYNCNCNGGYTGINCEANIDDCSPHPCGNGSCVDGVEDYTCNCDPGYTGDNCETEINECDPSPCVNGDCDDLINGYNCNCDDGYTGVNCETDIDDCAAPSPCVFGDCFDAVNDYNCICTAGYTGKNCDVELGLCKNATVSSNPTLNDQYCPLANRSCNGSEAWSNTEEGTFLHYMSTTLADFIRNVTCTESHSGGGGSDPECEWFINIFTTAGTDPVFGNTNELVTFSIDGLEHCVYIFFAYENQSFPLDYIIKGELVKFVIDNQQGVILVKNATVVGGNHTVEITEADDGEGLTTEATNVTQVPLTITQILELLIESLKNTADILQNLGPLG